jgi:hypothetical protein
MVATQVPDAGTMAIFCSAPTTPLKEVCAFSAEGVVDVCFKHMPPVRQVYAQAMIHEPAHLALAGAPLHCLYVVAMDGTDAEGVVSTVTAALEADDVCAMGTALVLPCLALPRLLD